ncbi:hypothetical protein [Streptosporangium sp. NPDC000509]|uniref:hypothetical protein n=1 Tax=Streptosporangium sp. NPDC000509 TaxID=3366186 RepID=UPI0036AC7131
MAGKKCEATFIARDGGESVTCDRDGRHIVHQESSTKTKAVRLPGGAFITKPTTK